MSGTRVLGMFRVSIRYGIPLLIVMFTTVFVAYTVRKEWGAAEDVVRGEAVSEMTNRVTLLEKQLSYGFGHGGEERIAQEMSLLGSAPGPQVAILADDTLVVLGATNPEWVGRSLGEVAEALLPNWPGEHLETIIARVRAQFAGELYLVAGGRYVLAIYPVKLDTLAGARPRERVGVLIVQRDLLPQLAFARRRPTAGGSWRSGSPTGSRRSNSARSTPSYWSATGGASRR